jgi:hypothetical protein
MKRLLKRLETIITLFVDGHIFWWFELRKEKKSKIWSNSHLAGRR